MGQILGLGITHYPPLSYKGNMTGRIKLLVADPMLPERLRTPEGWHPTMREQWSTDEGARPLRQAPQRSDPSLPKDPRRARCLRAGFRPALGRRPVRELPRGLRAAVLDPRLRLGRRSALEGSPRRELVGRAEGQDVHDHRPSRGREVSGRSTTRRRGRRRLCLQAAASPARPRVREFRPVPGHGPEGLPLPGRAVLRELVRPLADRGPRRADDAVASREAREPDRARSAGPPAVALLPGRWRHRPRADREPLAGRRDRLVELEPFVPGREERADVPGRRVGPALLRGPARWRLGDRGAPPRSPRPRIAAITSS